MTVKKLLPPKPIGLPENLQKLSIIGEPEKPKSSTKEEVETWKRIT